MSIPRNLSFLAEGASSTGVLAVTNGGTGLTVSSGASSVALRDSSANITANYFYAGFSNTAAAGTTTTLTAASVFNYVVTGSGGQTFKLPDATTLSVGAVYIFNNNQSSGTIVVQNNSTTTVVTIQSGSVVYLTLLTNSIAAGTWDTHYGTPSNASWSTNTLSWAGSITSATWNGVAVGVAYGGTGVTTSTGTGSVVLSTTPTFTTNITAPLVIGGTAASSALTLESTSGVGTTDYVAFLTGSQSERMRITSAGYVGIGTTTPQGLLQVTAATNDTLLVRGHQGLADGASIYSVNSANSAVKGMEIAASKIYLSTANVGIGTTTPLGALHVPGDVNTTAAVFNNIAEPTTISATAATGTIALYPSTQSILYYTSNASANWTVNITFSATNSMSNVMTTGQTMTVTFMVTQGATAYYNNVVQVDGVTVTPKWQGGTAPTAGNASGVDVYTYSAIKTGAGAFTVFASVTQFK